MKSIYLQGELCVFYQATFTNQWQRLPCRLEEQGIEPATFQRAECNPRTTAALRLLTMCSLKSWMDGWMEGVDEGMDG